MVPTSSQHVAWLHQPLPERMVDQGWLEAKYSVVRKTRGEVVIYYKWYHKDEAREHTKGVFGQDRVLNFTVVTLSYGIFCSNPEHV